MVKNHSHTSGLPVRPLIALGISLVICSLVGGYQAFINSLPNREVTEIITEAAKGDYTVEITLSFDAQGDAFDPTSLLVRLDGESVLEKSEVVRAGTPVKIHPVANLKVGINEFFIQVGTAETPSVPQNDGDVDDPFAAAGFGDAAEDASDFGDDFDSTDQEDSPPQTDAVAVAKAVRVRIFDGDEVLVEKTVWSEPGETISSTVVVDVPENDPSPDTSTHDHSGHNH